jgi:hypothetical protein
MHHLNDPGRKGLQAAAARTFLEHVEAGVPLLGAPLLSVENPAIDLLANDRQQPPRGQATRSIQRVDAARGVTLGASLNDQRVKQFSSDPDL